LRLTPPLNISDSAIDRAALVLDQAIRAIAA
jgi:4-aminobutyrate aminotransferase-like enzyme